MSTLAYINLHKILVTPIVLAMMWYFANGSIEAWIYLALHGTYSILWLVKEATYPDRRFLEQVPPRWSGWLLIFLPLAGYYAAPFMLISRHVMLPGWLLAMVIAIFIAGVFLHYVSDAQKYYTLRVQKGLITDGLFARTRNPNYLGEILIYASLALMSLHWLPFLVLSGWSVFFVRNMRMKDRSMARHVGFAEYKARTNLLLPRLFNTDRGTQVSNMNA